MKKVIVMLDCVLSFSAARTSRNQYRRGSFFFAEFGFPKHTFHPCYALARYSFASDVVNLLETNTKLA